MYEDAEPLYALVTSQQLPQTDLYISLRASNYIEISILQLMKLLDVLLELV